jgi:thiol-disulfide isomerase/thioredoxin
LPLNLLTQLPNCQPHKSYKMQRIKKVLTSILILTVLSCSENRLNPIKTGLEGTTLPTFLVRSIDSSTKLYTENIAKGNPFVLFIFSPTCPYCRAEMSDILKNNSKTPNIEYYVITNESFAAFKSFYRHYRLNLYNNIVAGQDPKNYLASHFNIDAVPYTLLYNKEQKLDKAFLGKISVAQIKEELGYN